MKDYRLMNNKIDDASSLESITTTKIFYFSLFSMSAMTVLGSTVIAPSLPNIEKHFISIVNIDLLSRLVLTLPALFIVILAPISGFILDKYKKLKIIFIFIVVWSISGSIGFFLDNIYYILISRAIFGIATAFVMTGSSALIGDYYSGNKRERAISIQGFYTAIGGALCTILGGLLTTISWRYPFLVYMFGFIILCFAYINLFEPSRSKIRVNNNHSFKFIKFLPIYLISFFGMTLFYVIPTQIPFFITSVLYKNGDLIGLSLAISAICTAFASLFSRKLITRFSANIVYAIAFSVMGVGYCLIYIFHNYIVMLIALTLIGSSLGILLVKNNSWLFSLTNNNTRAKAYGFLASSIFIGQFLSPIIMQPFLNMFGIINLFLLLGVLLIMVAFISLIKK